MPIRYMPPGTKDLGAIVQDEFEFRLRLDEPSHTVYLFLPSDSELPVEERPPAALANCARWAWPKLALYADELYKRSRAEPHWAEALRNQISIAVRRHRREADADKTGTS
ncbi:hypothetical protein [Salininema proteolyticum]|uniref:Uncharacterized protein n=1 Tax=Salininema proteolyticum TaxID=1607685 RepID=A0ABV8TUS3_9ACTN